MIDFDDFYAVAPANRCVYRPTRDFWHNEAVDHRLPPRPVLDADGKPVRGSNGKVKMIPASTWLAQHRSVERMTWAPGEPEVIEGKLLIDDGWIEKPGARTYNTYLPPTIRLGDPAQAMRWLEYWYKLYPRDIAEHCIAWLAHRRQYPGIKPNHGLVLIGAPGIGKDMALVPVRYAVGTWNFRDIALNDLVGKNNDFLCAVIVRVNEARDVGDANRGRIDRYGLHDHMKALMASPPETHRINRKYIPEYISLSRAGFITTSNHDDATYLPADDRRNAIAKSERMPADFHKDYFDELVHWYYHEGGINHVVAYLQSYDLANFNPKLAPPKTEAFWGMVNVDLGPDHGELTDAIDALGEQLGKKQGKKPDAYGNYDPPDALTVALLLTVAPSLEWLTDRKMSRAIAHRIKRCGYIVTQNRDAMQSGGAWKIKGKRTMIYARAELSGDQRHAAACALRDMLAEKPKLVVDNEPRETEQ
jgi:hypothetical protein